MGIAFAAFWLLMFWGLYDGEVYPKEAVLLGAIWFLILAFWILVPKLEWVALAGFVLMAIFMLFKTGIVNAPGGRM